MMASYHGTHMFDNPVATTYTQMMRVRISQASIEDIALIRSVQRQTWLATYPNREFGITRKDIADKFAHDDSPAGRSLWFAQKVAEQGNARLCAWVARMDDEVVAYATAEKEQTQNRLHALYVLPSYQKQGIGKALLETVMVWFGGEKRVYLNVASYNGKAIAFYEKLGFYRTNSTVSDEVAALSSGKVIPEIEMVKGV